MLLLVQAPFGSLLNLHKCLTSSSFAKDLFDIGLQVRNLIGTLFLLLSSSSIVPQVQLHSSAEPIVG